MANGGRQIPWVNHIMDTFVPAVTGLIMFSTAGYMFLRMWRHDHGQSQVFSTSEARWWFICWSVLPPVMFYLEYVFFFHGKGNAESVRKFDQGQMVTQRIWIAIVAVLTVLYLKP
ncbi:MAG TPA: hypothetical protein VF669_08625 [Tepidisphaeraceae bacterium]|jgi:hypothetical protein